MARRVVLRVGFAVMRHLRCAWGRIIATDDCVVASIDLMDTSTKVCRTGECDRQAGPPSGSCLPAEPDPKGHFATAPATGSMPTRNASTLTW